jgi:GTPase
MNPDEHNEHTGAEMPDTEADKRARTMSVMPGVEQPESISPERKTARRNVLSIDEHVEGILAGDMVVLAQAITLVESRLPEHGAKALQIIERVLPKTGNSIRIGITGVPGVGKSTFIEALGLHLVEQGHRIAVLAIDPSSKISGGSIMGDKTRMEQLSGHENAFIRPSPSAGSLGGVARKTREVMLLCEAAGYDVVLIETVGVGQSETMVHSMVDFFLLLMLAGAGDELQGIKRGIMELADGVAINKADGDNIPAAQRALTDYRNALHLMQYPYPDWSPPVELCSAMTGSGIPECWSMVEEFRRIMDANGTLQQKRSVQSRDWMLETIYTALQDRFISHKDVVSMLPDLERAVQSGELPPLVAANQLLRLFFNEDVQTL